VLLEEQPSYDVSLGAISVCILSPYELMAKELFVYIRILAVSWNYWYIVLQEHFENIFDNLLPSSVLGEIHLNLKIPSVTTEAKLKILLD